MRAKYGAPCDCHGEPMTWNKDKRRPAGGFWRCAVRKRELNRIAYRENGWYAARNKRNTRKALAIRVAELEKSREMWKQRALAAEWGLKQARPNDVQKRAARRGNGAEMRTQKNGGVERANLTVAA